MSVKVKTIYLSFICLLILSGGCVKTANMYHGNLISSVPVVTLQEGGPYADRWETFDLVSRAANPIL